MYTVPAITKTGRTSLDQSHGDDVKTYQNVPGFSEIKIFTVRSEYEQQFAGAEIGTSS